MADDWVTGGMPRGEPLYVENKLKIDWHDAPERTSWGGGMMQATIELDKDNTLDLYCDRDAIHLVDAALRKLVESSKRVVGYRSVGNRAAPVAEGEEPAREPTIEKTVLVADALLAKAPKQ